MLEIARVAPRQTVFDLPPVHLHTVAADVCDRSLRLQQKAEAKLEPKRARPKGTRRATRERLLNIIWDCEEVRENEVASFMHRMRQ